MIIKEKIKEIMNKKMLEKFVTELLKIKEIEVKIKDVTIYEYSFKCRVDLKFKYCYSDIENVKEFLRDNIKAYDVDVKLINKEIWLFFYMEKLPILEFKKVELKEKELLLGYNYEGNIVCDMNITPHILITGLSGQGKTQLVNSLVNNLYAKDVILINCFRKDFKGFKGKFVNGSVNILEELLKMLEGQGNEKYIIVDELLVLCKDKNINKAIMDLLAIGRHLEKYLICISQIGTKEQLKFKELFNARVCFRCVEESTYRTVLGCSIGSILEKREFYFLGNELVKGQTFTNLVN